MWRTISGQNCLAVSRNDARLVFVTGNVLAFKQHPLDGMIDSRRLVDGLTGGRLAGDLTPQSFIVSRRDFNEYIHGVTSLWLRRVNSFNGSNVQWVQIVRPGRFSNTLVRIKLT